MRKSLLAGVSAMSLLAAAPAVASPSADYLAFLARGHADGFAIETKDGDVTLDQLKTVLDGLGKTFSEFKEANDERIGEVEKRGQADPLLDEKLVKINTELDKYAGLKSDLDNLWKKLNRPGAGGGVAELSDEAIAHKTAFDAWVRDPYNPDKKQSLHVAEKLAAEAKAVQTTVAADGGHGVPEELSSAINERVVDISPMRQVSQVITVGTSDYKEIVDTNGDTYGWAGETDARSETDTSSLEEVAPSQGTVYAYPKTTEEALDDIFFNVEAWLLRKSVRSLAKGEGNAFTVGDGTKKPTGFLDGTPVATADDSRAFGVLEYIASGAAADFAASDPSDALIDVQTALAPGYRANAIWMANRATVGRIRKFKDGQGNYLWQPSFVLGQPSTLMGHGLVENEEMSDVGANAFPLAFGDFKEGYLITDRHGIRITVNAISVPGYVLFYVRKRTGGKVVEDRAIKLLKISA